MAGAKSFAIAARRATVGSGIFPALLHWSERAQNQPQFAHLFFARAHRALAIAPQPWPEKRRIFGLRHCQNPELPDAAAAKLFLQLGTFHDGDAAHLHWAPDHSRRVTPLLRGVPLDGGPVLPQLRCSVDAGHGSKKQFPFFSMRKIYEIARKEKNL
jgi:hypothetical protein